MRVWIHIQCIKFARKMPYCRQVLLSALHILAHEIAQAG